MEREWVDFKDRTPVEHGVSVEVRDGDNDPEIATYCCSEDEYWLAVKYKNEHGFHETKATHWRLVV